MNNMKTLIKQFHNINAQDDQGRTALHFAAKQGNDAAINILERNGSSWNIPDYQGKTPKDL